MSTIPKNDTHISLLILAKVSHQLYLSRLIHRAGLGGTEFYSGKATCFDDSTLFCNTGLGKGCPGGYKHGMTAAWPNVCYICGKNNCYQKRCDKGGGSVKPVKRGDKITVTAVENPKCSFNPTVVDTGPNYNKIHKLGYLSIPAAQAMYNCLNKKWKICRKYDDSIVNVAIMTRVDCLKLPGGPCL